MPDYESWLKMDPVLLGNVVAVILGSSVVGGVVAGYFKLRENRTTLRYGYDIQEAQRNARWNAAYRAAAEVHLVYDLERDQNIYELRSIVNHLLQRLGEPAREFTPLRPPPPLFPILEESSNPRG